MAIIDYIVRDNKVGPITAKALSFFLQCNGIECVEHLRSITKCSLLVMWESFLMNPNIPREMSRCKMLVPVLTSALGLAVSSIEKQRIRKRVYFRTFGATSKRILDTPACNSGVLALVLRCCVSKKCWKWLVARISQFLELNTIDTIDKLADLDRHGLEALVADTCSTQKWNSTIRRCLTSYLHTAKLHPSVDPQGRYSSHLRYLPLGLMCQYQVLWDFPVSLGRFLLKKCHEGDYVLVLQIAERCCCVEGLISKPAREDRFKRAQVRRLTEVLGWIMRASPGEQLTSTICEKVNCSEDLVQLIGKTVAVQNMHITMKTSHPIQPHYSPFDRAIREFQRFIDTGVFAPVLDASYRITKRLVHDKIRQFTMEDPRSYRLKPLTQTVSKTYLQTSDVDQMASVCRDAREVALFALLRAYGLRAEALETTRVDGVYDTVAMRVREIFTFVEKNAKVRRVRVTPSVVKIMSNYIAQIPCAFLYADNYLFAHPQRPMDRCRGLVGNFMKTLCKRAFNGTRRFHPHLFRHWIVCKAMARGVSLDVVSKWLGHSSGCVTERYCWVDECLDIDMVLEGATHDETGSEIAQSTESGTTELLCNKYKSVVDKLIFYRQKMRDHGISVSDSSDADDESDGCESVVTP